MALNQEVMGSNPALVLIILYSDSGQTSVVEALSVGLSRSSCDLLTYIHLFTVCFSYPHISVLSVSLRCEYLRILIIITLLTFT